MTTQDYQIGVGLQACLVAVFGIFATFMGLGSVHEYKARASYLEAVGQREYGTEASLRVLEVSLGKALQEKPDLAAALMLRGWLGIELNDPKVVKESYQKLKDVQQNKGLPQGIADNGLGCALIMEIGTIKEADARKKVLEQAYQLFVSAAKEDWNNADPHVNAAICKLYYPERSALVAAAEHLADAKKSKNFSYDALVSYHAALGTLLVRAHLDKNVAQQVADKLHDEDKELYKTGRMLVRGANELEKAAAIARTESLKFKLNTHLALAQAKIVVWAPLPKRTLIDMCNNIAWQAEKNKTNYTPQQRQMLFSTAALVHSRIGARDAVAKYARNAVSKKGTDIGSLIQVGAAYVNSIQRAGTPLERSEHLKNGVAYAQQLIATPGADTATVYMGKRILANMYFSYGDFKSALATLQSADAPETIGDLSSAEQAALYRNIAIVQLSGKEKDSVGALESARKAMAANKEDAIAKQILAGLAGQIQILNIKASQGEKLPPSLPIISAKITGGVEAVSAENVAIEIDGTAVEVKAGNGGMFYAVPQKPLSEGTHKVKITASAQDREPATAESEIVVKFDDFIKAAR